MSNLVPAEDIERVVGIARHETAHYGRAVSSERRVYVLHSHACKSSGIDLRECEYSMALDEGIDRRDWADDEDRPVRLGFLRGRLIPAPTTAAQDNATPVAEKE